MSKEPVKQALAPSFMQKVESLFNHNERAVYCMDTPQQKIFLSTAGIYYQGRKNWFQNKTTIIFYPKSAIESIQYIEQGWFLPAVALELVIKGRVKHEEMKTEALPIRLKFKDTEKEKCHTLLTFCKELISA
ncbi:hypothetical protein [Neisseria sp. Ec49-e6-T10]|uniref:hypothetical protein n=1 Tax=Neisseria sp. Ec49-e6-T10 TaxID=3140744 RepID=UPI003EBCF7D0